MVFHLYFGLILVFKSRVKIRASIEEKKGVLGSIRGGILFNWQQNVEYKNHILLLI